MSQFTFLREIKATLRALANPAQAAVLQRFFKTAPGEYGAGDAFLGIKVPVLRGLAKQYRYAAFGTVEALLQSEFHEERLLALLILVYAYEKAGAEQREKIATFYWEQRHRINNWDLVDVTTPQILGDFLADKSRAPLYQLAQSTSLWERRMAIMATLAFIRRHDFADTLRIAEMLLADGHDLIHKAVGWMLREIGKRDLAAEQGFLDRHAAKMPRTMLRYAIERFPEPLRQRYLNGAA
ncbi:MAG: DNA alkylation repair protein [Pseudomonadota bacterium]